MTPLYAGWGFRAAAQRQSFDSCWQQAGQVLALAPGVWTFAVLESKLQTAAWDAFQAWARDAAPHAPCRAWPESAVAQIDTPSSSPRLVARFATGSVCEALALHAARTQGGAPATLLLQRIVSADRQATLAIGTVAAATVAAATLAAATPAHSLETGVLS